MKGALHKILLVILFAVLLLPLFVHYVPIIKSNPLYGSYATEGELPFTYKNWISGAYQEQENKHLNDYLNFRADLVRMNCQIDYSLFKKMNTGWGILGKHHCLLEQKYVEAWSGYDYMGYDTIHSKLVKLKALQDTLGKLGKSLILIHPASKAYYYADCIPDASIPAIKRPTNFATCLRLGDSLGINQLNLNTWFCNMRDTSKELLYTKQGIHWSFYGGMVAADTIIKYIERLRKIAMPHPHWISIEHTNKPRFTDDDIAICMNLIWPFTTETYTYGTTVCDTAVGKTKPRAIYIGDSFMWPLIDNDVMGCINSSWEFWYYFKTKYTYMGLPRRPKPMEGYDWQEALDKTDYVLIMYNASNLSELGNGFIEAAYSHYYPGRK